MMGKRSLTFYDVKAKRKFTTSKYKTRRKKVRGSTTTFAVAKSPFTGISCYRVIKRGRRRGRG